MRENHDRGETTAPQPTAESIINGIIQFDNPESIQEDLTEMFESFIMSENEPLYEIKMKVFETYNALRSMLKLISLYKERRAV